jgi:hypothetical protein
VRTWQLEALVASAVLLAGWWIFWRTPIELLGTLAVLLTFCHAQVADRLSEAEGERPQPKVECHRWERRYFLSKETIWAAYFGFQCAWSPLVGVALLTGYRVWRTWRRARKNGDSR